MTIWRQAHACRQIAIKNPLGNLIEALGQYEQSSDRRLANLAAGVLHRIRMK
jgi:hypothetical protein